LHKKVSFIIPIFNNLKESKQMLASLIASLPKKLEFEIVIINDSSYEEGVDLWLNSLNYKDIKVLSNSENLGYAKTNNIAAMTATGEFLVFLNSDLLFKTKWFESMYDLINNETLNIGIVGNVQYEAASLKLDHAGICVTKDAKISHIKEIDNKLKQKNCFATTAACCLIRKSDFIAIGRFDEKFINGGEDIDLCMAMKKFGKRIYISLDSKIQHHISLSRDKKNIQNEINSRLFFSKWREQIKQEVSKQWSSFLKVYKVNYSNFIDGELEAFFKSSYNTASMVLAEHFISNEELRWSKLIDQINPNDKIQEKTYFKGLKYIDSFKCYLPSPDLEVILTNTKSITNFYICGRRIDPNNKDNILITIFVNDIQYKAIHLQNSPNINVGIINPILLQGLSNKFKISVSLIEPSDNIILGDASHLIYVSHFVIDDQLIKKH
jgi:GT2 family glycosyltransferase